MDVLRSAHTTTAWVGADNDRQAEIRWYKCAEGAKAFPHFHAFGNPVWEPFPDEWTDGPGVEMEPIKWVKKDIDPPAGDHFHGDPSWYEKGIPQAVFDNPTPYEKTPCVRWPVVPVGGLRLGGRAMIPPAGGVRLGVTAWSYSYPPPE